MEIMIHATIAFNLLTTMTKILIWSSLIIKARRHQQQLCHTDRAFNGKCGSKVHRKHKEALSFDVKNKATMWHSITHAISQES